MKATNVKRIVLLMLFACGAAPELDGPKLQPGRYIADGYVAAGSTEGTCAWLPREFHSYVSVDENGQVASPLAGSITCTTTYVDGVTINCSGLGADLEAHAALWRDGGSAEGAGEVRGNVAGCKRAVVGFFMELE